MIKDAAAHDHPADEGDADDVDGLVLADDADYENDWDDDDADDVVDLVCTEFNGAVGLTSKACYYRMD